MCLYDHKFTFPANRLNEVCLDNIESDYTILFIYDPDCGHCKKATPKLVDFEKFMDYGISVYAVSTTVHDSAQSQMARVYKSKGLEKFYNVAGYSIIVAWNNYDLSATLAVFVLDAEKRIIGKRLGVEQIEQFIQVIGRPTTVNDLIALKMILDHSRILSKNYVASERQEKMRRNIWGDSTITKRWSTFDYSF